jgi:hypothetical protein
LIAGVLDIAYSQNYNISLTYTLGFIKELTKEKDIQEVLLMLGDFFANNPKILTLDAERKDLWSKSASDLSDFFYFFDNFYKSFCEEKDSSEASKIMIDRNRFSIRFGESAISNFRTNRADCVK